MTGALRLQTWKELRALLPWWAATVATLAGFGMVQVMGDFSRNEISRLQLAATCVYFAGAGALGALSVGHEFTYRTVQALFAQPVRRSQLLSVKLAVLAVLLLGLAGTVSLIPEPNFITAGSLMDRAGLWLPLMCGLFLAPWLTIVTRSALAGAVFSIALPMIILSFMVATDIKGSAILAVSALGSVLTWRIFLRLEALDEGRGHIGVPAWLKRPMVEDRPRPAPGWLGPLVHKELRLQQMTFVVSALYAAAWAAMLVARRFDPDYLDVGPRVYAVTGLHSGIIALMAGALPAADERQYATADWQALLPIATWKQWLLKAALAIGLAVGLGLGLPALLGWIHPWPDDVEFSWEQIHILVLLAATALYVSSVSTTGLRALLAAIPIVAGASVASATVLYPLMSALRRIGGPWAYSLVGPATLDASSARLVAIIAISVLLGGLTLLLLGMGLRNHRSADRSRGRLLRQAGWIAAYVAAGIAVLTLLSLITSAGLRLQVP